MNKDIEILLEVKGKFQGLSRASAVKHVANSRNLTVSGVSGMVSRAENTIAGRVALMQWLQDNNTHTDAAQIEIDNKVHEGLQRFIKHRRELGEGVTHAVFLSDTHFPYHDVQALELAYEIIADLPDVSYISGLSDGFDLSTKSFWPDGRKAKDRAIDSDLRGVVNLYKYHLETLKQLAPKALVLALVGNHDVRLINGNSGSENYLQLEVMENLINSGMTFLSDFSRENIIQISPTVFWYHGNHARKNRLGGAKVNYEHVKNTIQARSDFTLVFGHVHDPVHYQAIKANAYGAGCLCQLQPHYNRHAQNWKQGIVVSRLIQKFGKHSDLTYPINFDRVGNQLTAFNPLNGKSYEV